MAGGAGDAQSRSHGHALGASNVEVWDSASGGSSSGSTGFSVDGGDASSTSIAESTGGLRARANATAIGGSIRPSSSPVAVRAGRAEAVAQARGAVESLATAISEAGRVLSISNSAFPSVESLAHSEAHATGETATARAEARGQVGEIGGSVFNTIALASSHTRGEQDDARSSAETNVGGSGRIAFESAAQAAASVSGLHARAGEWGRVGLALNADLKDTNIVLEAAGELAQSGFRLPVNSLRGVYVSFLDFSLVGEIADDMIFRIENADGLLLERTFAANQEAEAFFTSVLDLGNFADSSVLETLALRFSLTISDGSLPKNVATYFAIGTTVVPEPGTSVLILLGLVAFSAGRPRASRVRR